MRKRDRAFCDELLKNIALCDGMTDVALADAYCGVYRTPHFITDEAQVYEYALRKAREKLKLVDVREGLRDVFAYAGFDVLEAAQLHIKHMRGDVKRDVLTERGVVKMKMPPNYQALRDYEKMTMPQAPTRVEKRVLVGHTQVERNVTPPIAPRSIGTAVLEEEVVDDGTTED